MRNTCGSFLFIILLFRGCLGVLDPRVDPGVINGEGEALTPISPSSQHGPQEGICPLPKSLGYSGVTNLLEDCSTLSRFQDDLPVLSSHYGSSILICCPEDQHKVIFPDDYLDEIPEGEEYEYAYDYSDLEESIEALVTPKPERDNCFSGEKCTPATECESLASQSFPPSICEWNPTIKNFNVCCDKVTNNSPRINVRGFGNFQDVRKRYDCEDYVPQCREWASKFPESCINEDHNSFPFMTKACMKSCRICGRNECVDEFEQCGEWTKGGHCVKSSQFMSLNCRASCGICGYLSYRNRELQLVKGREYSNIGHSRFFCGTSKLKDGEEEPEEPTTTVKDDLLDDIFGFDTRQFQLEDFPSPSQEEDVDLGKFFFYQTDAENSERNIFCGSTIIADRFIISAAHCYINFQGGPYSTINSIILRDDSNHTEDIEIRRIHLYPTFKLPSLYNDIAVAELGRRVKFDYDTFGDSPACLGRPGDTYIGQEARSQGYGFTEDAVTSDVLLESTNYIIPNDECANILSFNTSRHINYRTRLRRALDMGVNEQLLCTLGEKNETSGVYSGPCEGDSGGPLFITVDKKEILAGIVSGGLGCGSNIPKWYTRISTYIPWIQCIISETKKGKSKARIELACLKHVKDFEVENQLYT